MDTLIPNTQLLNQVTCSSHFILFYFHSHAFLFHPYSILFCPHSIPQGSTMSRASTASMSLTVSLSWKDCFCGREGEGSFLSPWRLRVRLKEI